MLDKLRRIKTRQPSPDPHISKNKVFYKSIGCLIVFCISKSCLGQSIFVHDDPSAQKIVFGNEKLQLTLNYGHSAVITQFKVNGMAVIENEEGVYSMIRTRSAVYSSLNLQKAPSVLISKDRLTVSDIRYGDEEVAINETWTFTVTSEDIKFDIARTSSVPVLAEKLASPVFTFDNINTWDGAYQDYGGLAWFYLFNKQRDTYGVYSSRSDFWNSKNGNGLTIAVSSPGRQIVMDYSRTTNDRLAYTIGVSDGEMLPRFDSGTNRRRYVRDTTDVWAPVSLSAGKTNQSIRFYYFNFGEKYGRGQLVGINQEQVSSVLNTIARIGVIGKNHFGCNSWHTPYGPICLHEQYIAQMGLGINDENYLKGYQDCLDFYRDNAIRPDGRVWPRWAYSNEDAMPNKLTDKGFYEAQWGYLLDSNPDYVTNVAELYDQTGNLNWLKTQQKACEKALDWILNRDSNNNGLVEMMTDSHKEKRGSDWIDIIWAAYENAFVNAKLYHALVKWAAIEKQLGNSEKVKQYASFAGKLKTSFNKSTAEGGFWDSEQKCYIHWRDKDGSVHGNNMVTPVNFMAIAYGICDDDARVKSILDEIESQMNKENLFFWPICLYSYSPGEGNDWQFPFPNYENGDIFLSWGAVAVKAYARYKPELAVKYIRNVLARYEKDGLAFQRYGRARQDGLGDDILSGNALSVVGLYQAIYGVNPLYNRFYLDPHITPELAGTKLKYKFRKEILNIELDMNLYSISNHQFKITGKTDFGFFTTSTNLEYFHGKKDRPSLKINLASKEKLALCIQNCTPEEFSFDEENEKTKQVKRNYRLNDFRSNTFYEVKINGKMYKKIKTDTAGALSFDWTPQEQNEKVVIKRLEDH